MSQTCQIIIGLVVGALLVLIVSICVDCASGVTRYTEAQVHHRYHISAWTEVSTYVDGDGNSRIRTIRHPEQFHLVVDALDGSETFDIQSRKDYMTRTNGEIVTVRSRQGKWSGTHYLPSIH